MRPPVVALPPNALNGGPGRGLLLPHYLNEHIRDYIRCQFLTSFCSEGRLFTNTPPAN